jgi:ATP-dependent DNA ligase
LSNRPTVAGRTSAGGPNWLHEIKHDGFRMMARQDATGERLHPRNGNDFADRFSLIAAAVTPVPARS